MTRPILPILVSVAATLSSGCDALWIDDSELCYEQSEWFRDHDNDGYGAEGDSIWACSSRGEYRAFDDSHFDCDDDDPAWNIRCRWVQVETEYARTCARDTEGGVTCWGSTSGGLQPPTGGGPFTTMSVGFYATCALDEVGRITCWGAENDGDPLDEATRVVSGAPTQPGYTAISVGSNHACALDAAGALTCWGADRFLPAPDLDTRGPFVEVQAGQFATAARGEDGGVDYWGDDGTFHEDHDRRTFDQVAMGSYTRCRRAGTEVTCDGFFRDDWSSLESGTEVVAGGVHACSRGENNNWSCFNTDYRAEWPSPLEPLETLSAGYTHDCGLRSDGVIACYGTPYISSATAIPQRYTLVAAGAGFTTAVRDGSNLVIWGEPPELTWSVPDLVQLDGGGALCGLTDDGQLLCWGSGVALSDAGPYTAVAAAPFGACGLGEDGRVTCFGTPDSVSAWATPGGRFDVIDAGSKGACGIRSGAVSCWNAFSQASISSSPEPFVTVGVGDQRACGLRADGKARCWDFWSEGTQWSLDGDPDLLDLAVARSHTCGILDVAAVDATGPVQCWQLDDTAPSIDDLPPSTEHFRRIYATDTYTCALDLDGSPTCWGDDTVSAATPTDQHFDSLALAAVACGLRAGERPVCWPSEPDFGPTHPSVVAAGAEHVCITGDQGTACFGADSDGQSSPPDAGPYDVLSAGRAHTCGISGDGAVTCWGDDSYGQLDAPTGAYAALSSGGNRACALDRDGRAACWGDDTWGMPAEWEDTAFAEIAVGVHHSCVRTEDGEIQCSGDDSQGQLDAPEGVFTALAAGGWHTCALDLDGVAHCWGLDSQGQVSDVPAWSFVAITAGEEHSCGLKGDGLAVCWGRNLEEQSAAPLPWD